MTPEFYSGIITFTPLGEQTHFTLQVSNYHPKHDGSVRAILSHPGLQPSLMCTIPLHQNDPMKKLSPIKRL